MKFSQEDLTAISRIIYQLCFLKIINLDAVWVANGIISQRRSMLYSVEEEQ